jgi:hypothetical protein
MEGTVNAYPVSVNWAEVQIGSSPGYFGGIQPLYTGTAVGPMPE